VSDRQAYLSGITGYSGVEAIADKKIKQWYKSMEVCHGGANLKGFIVYLSCSRKCWDSVLK
jgi:hypothetical protein